MRCFCSCIRFPAVLADFVADSPEARLVGFFARGPFVVRALISRRADSQCSRYFLAGTRRIASPITSNGKSSTRLKRTSDSTSKCQPIGWRATSDAGDHYHSGRSRNPVRQHRVLTQPRLAPCAPRVPGGSLSEFMNHGGHREHGGSRSVFCSLSSLYCLPFPWSIQQIAE